MRKSLKCLIALIFVLIFIQLCVGQPSCRIIVNNGGAAGAAVSVNQGPQRIAWGSTDNYGVFWTYLYPGQYYTVIVDWNGRHSSTDITANDPVYVSV